MEPGSTQFVAIGILLCMSAFFSMAETALTSLSKIRLRNMLEENIKGAALVNKLLSNQKELLSAILVANNLINITISSLVTAMAISFAGNDGWAVGLATGVATLFILVFGEITPKTIAAQNAEDISLLVAGPINVMLWIFRPIVYFIGIITNTLLKLAGADPNKSVPIITESELKTMVNVSHEEGFLEIDERQMIHNVFNFGDNRARDVMIPRTDMIAVSVETSYSEIKSRFQEEHFSRMPVYKDNTDDIIGILHLKDFAFYSDTEDKFRVENFVRETLFTYESKPADELFNLMRQKRVSVAIVLDEYGGTAGMVTLEDLIEEIVGDIEDEYDDAEEDIRVIKDDEYLVDGSTKIDDLNDMIGTNIESEDFDSIGGYVIGVLGYIPENGETVKHGELTFTIEELDKNRISKLRICLSGGIA